MERCKHDVQEDIILIHNLHLLKRYNGANLIQVFPDKGFKQRGDLHCQNHIFTGRHVYNTLQ